MPQILFFAAARDATGTRMATFDGDTVDRVLDAAVAQFGEKLAVLLPFCTLMAGDERVSRGTPIAGDQQLAVLPPVSGGDGEPAHLRAGVLTVSDRASAGEYADLTGREIESVLSNWGIEVAARDLVGDEIEQITSVLKEWSSVGFDLIFTNGGTGIAGRDVTPEATRAALDREIPGIGELMRAKGGASTPLAALSRQTAGVIGSTLVINVPGSPQGAVESLNAVKPVVHHAIAQLRGAGHD